MLSKPPQSLVCPERAGWIWLPENSHYFLGKRILAAKPDKPLHWPTVCCYVSGHTDWEERMHAGTISSNEPRAAPLGFTRYVTASTSKSIWTPMFMTSQHHRDLREYAIKLRNRSIKIYGCWPQRNAENSWFFSIPLHLSLQGRKLFVF